MLSRRIFRISLTIATSFRSFSSEVKTFRVCTFNILAPCYKRLSSEKDRESTHPTLWQTRHLSIIKLLQSLNVHLICLQEFWFKNISFVQLYKSHFLSNYSFYSLQRTNSLDDGLAILVDQRYFQVIAKHELILNDIGNRVGLLLHLQINGKNLLLINLHLTFPHHRFERRVRFKQMKSFLRMISHYQETKNLSDQCSILLCGDFNSPSRQDPVYQLLIKHFQSSYRVVHGFEPPVTHLTHRNEELGVDFIFYQSNDFQSISSELIPLGCNPSAWNDHSEWILSDHRPLLSTFQLN